MPGEPPLPAEPKLHDWFVEFCKRSPDLIIENGVRGNPTDIRQGIESILPGLEELKVSICHSMCITADSPVIDSKVKFRGRSLCSSYRE
jgi:hypothetical protein